MKNTLHTPYKLAAYRWLFANYKKVGLKIESLLPLFSQDVRLGLYHQKYSTLKEVYKKRVPQGIRFL